jgi:uncharacterized Zn-finger protein
MPPYRAFVEEWPEFADESAPDLRNSDHDTDIDPSVPVLKHAVSVQRDAWSETSEEEEDEISTPNAHEPQESVTSYDASEKGGLLKGLLDYAEYEGVGRDQEGAKKRQAEWIDISEDDILVKHEDVCDVDNRQVFKSVMLDNDAKKNLCNICLKRFSRTDALTRHYKAVHLRIKPLKRTHCGSRYTRKDLLGKHHGFCRVIRARAIVARVS